MSRIEALSLDNVSMDGDTQIREKIDYDVVGDYAEAMEAGAEFPPIVVFFDGKRHWLADGVHRFYAAQNAKKRHIQAEIRKGGKEAAQWYAIGANTAHGLRRTNADKRRAVELALKHANGAKMSDGKIAEHVGVADRTVNRIRAELEPTPTLSESPTRTGRDGRTIDTSNIGKGKSGEAREVKGPREVLAETEGPSTEDMEAAMEALDQAIRSAINDWLVSGMAGVPGVSIKIVLADVAEYFQD